MARRGYSAEDTRWAMAVVLGLGVSSVGRAGFAQPDATAPQGDPQPAPAESGAPPAPAESTPAPETTPAPGTAAAPAPAPQPDGTGTPAPAPSPAPAPQTPGGVAQPQPQPQPVPPADQPSAECPVPCPDGYACVQGQCIAPCAPACGPEYVCTEDRECVSREEIERAKQEEATRDLERERQERLRKKPRVFLYAGGGALIWPDISGSSDATIWYYGPAWQLGAAYQQHLARLFGMGGRVSIGFGPWYATIIREAEDPPSDCRYDPCREQANTPHGAFFYTAAEYALIIGPFGRFFLSPSAFASYIVFAGSGKEDYVRGDEFEYPTTSDSTAQGDGPEMALQRWENTGVAGAGLRLGFYLLAEEQLEISIATHVGLPTSTTSHLYIDLTSNIGYAFSLGD